MLKEKLQGFVMPTEKVFPNLILRKLTVSDAQADYEAVLVNGDLIRRTIGVDWPKDDFNYDDNRTDIERHEREFDSNDSYTFGVWDLARKEYLGCIYFYREEKPWFKTTPPPDCDVVLEFWVTQHAYERGLFKDLYTNINEWLNSGQLPFKHPHFNMADIPTG